MAHLRGTSRRSGRIRPRAQAARPMAPRKGPIVTPRPETPPLVAVARHEPPDPHQRLLELLVGGRVAHADVARARRPERAARDDRDPLLGRAGARRTRRWSSPVELIPRERIERAARLERRQAQRVEAVDQQPAPAVVLGDASPSPRVRLEERGERRVLGDGRRRHDPVLVDLDDPLDDPRRARTSSRRASRSWHTPWRSRPSGPSGRASRARSASPGGGTCRRRAGRRSRRCRRGGRARPAIRASASWTSSGRTAPVGLHG